MWMRLLRGIYAEPITRAVVAQLIILGLVAAWRKFWPEQGPSMTDVGWGFAIAASVLVITRQVDLLVREWNREARYRRLCGDLARDIHEWLSKRVANDPEPHHGVEPKLILAADHARSQYTKATLDGFQELFYARCLGLYRRAEGVGWISEKLENRLRKNYVTSTDDMRQIAVGFEVLAMRMEDHEKNKAPR